MNMGYLKKIGNPRVVVEPHAGESIGNCTVKCLQWAVMNWTPVELVFNHQHFYFEPDSLADFVDKKAHKA